MELATIGPESEQAKASIFFMSVAGNQGIDRVDDIDDRGIRDPEFTIHVDRVRAERYDLTLEEIVGLLGATNRNIPAGEVGGLVRAL